MAAPSTLTVNTNGTSVEFISTNDVAWVSIYTDTARTLSVLVDSGGSNERTLTVNLADPATGIAITGGGFNIATISYNLTSGAIYSGESVEIVTAESGILTDDVVDSDAIAAATSVTNNSTKARPTATINTLTAPILAGGFVTLNATYSGTTGTAPQHEVSWSVGLPGTTTFTVARDWLVPLYAGTTLSVNADMATDATGRNIGYFLEDSGTLTATATVRDATGAVTTSVEDSETVLGYDQYTTLNIDGTSTATGGVPFIDDCVGAVSTSMDGRSPSTNEWGQTWSELTGTWELDGNGYCFPPTANGAGNAILTIDSHVTDVEVECDIKQVDSDTWPNGPASRIQDTNNFFWCGLDYAAGEIQLYKVVSGSYTLLDSAAFSASLDTDYNIRMTDDGSDIEVFVDDVSTLTATDTDLAGNTLVGLVGRGISGGDAGHVVFKNFKLTLPSEGAGTSTSDAISDIDIAAGISQRSHDKMRFLVQPGTYTHTTTLHAYGSNVLWQAADYDDTPIMECSSFSGACFDLGDATVVSQRCAISGFRFQHTGGDGSSGNRPIEFGAAKMEACGVDRCSMIGADEEFFSFMGGTFLTVAGSSVCLTRNGNEGVAETTDNNHSAFGLDDTSVYIAMGNRVGGSDGAGVERPFRGNGGIQTHLCNKYDQTGGVKNSFRMQACKEAEVSGNHFASRPVSLGGNDGIVEDARFVRNYATGFDLADDSNDFNSFSQDIVIAGNIVDQSQEIVGVSTSVLDITNPFNNVLVAHNTFLSTTTGIELGSRSTTLPGTGDPADPAGVVTIDNNIFAISDGSGLRHYQRVNEDGFQAVFGNYTFDGNIWPQASETSVAPTIAYNPGSQSNEDTEAAWIALTDTANESFATVTVDANYVPSQQTDVTVPNGVHMDFFGVRLTPGDTVWAGAVAMALPSSVNITSTRKYHYYYGKRRR